MDQSAEAAFAVVENLWKRSFDISKNADDPLFSLHTKTFETIMVYMSQSLDYEYIEKEISSLENDRQLALQSENGYDAHRCLSFGLIEAVQIMMKKNTKKLEEMIKQGYILVPEIPNFPLEPKEEEIMDDPEPISADNEIYSPLLPKKNIEQPIDDFSHDFPADDQTSPLASIENDFQLKEDEIMHGDVNTGMDDFTPEIENSLTGLPLEDEIMEEPNETLADEVVPISNEVIDNDEIVNDNNDQDFPMDDGPLELNNSYNGMPSNGVQDQPVTKVILKLTPEDHKKPKEEPVDPDPVIPNHKQTTISEDMTAYYAIPEEKVDNFEIDSTDMDMPTRKRSQRTAKKTMKYVESDEDSEIAGPSMKKVKSESRKESNNTMKSHKRAVPDMKSATKKVRVTKVNDTELKCPKCKFITVSVMSWVNHIRETHSSSPMKLDLLLRCGCGQESVGDGNSRVCEVGNFTVIRKEDAKVKEGGSKKSDTYMECPKCEFRTPFVMSWLRHLSRSHSTTPRKAGVFLRCECGHECLSEAHSFKCDIANFTVIRKKDQPIEDPNKDDEKELDNSAVLHEMDESIGRKGGRELTLDEMEVE